MRKQQVPEEEVVRQEAKPERGSSGAAAPEVPRGRGAPAAGGSGDPARDPDPLAEHPAGVRRAIYLFVALCIGGLATYTTPALEELRPWTPGSRVPFTTLFEFRPPTRPRLAGVHEREAPGPKSGEELLSAAPLPEAAEPSPERPEAAEEAEGIDPALRIPPEAWAGMTRAIEDPDGSMGHFYSRLAALLGGEHTIARVTLYSDSINGSDRTSRALRELFAERFGHAGKGWVPISPGWQYQRPKNVQWRHGGWRVFVVNRGEVEGGRYGLGGVLAENRRPRAWARFGTVGDGPIGAQVSLFRLYYQAFPGGGRLSLAVDGGTPQELDTAADEVRDRVHDVRVPEGPHSLELRVTDGDVRLYGVVMESDPPGVVVDGIPLIGAFTRVLLNFDAEHWAGQIAQREPDLLAFWLGGNDSVSESVAFRPEQYVENYTQVLRNARAGRPEASCLVVSVLDSAERVEGRVRSLQRIPRVVEAQREAALAAGCAFFDAYEATGGMGTMRRWARASPRLVSVDYRHLSSEGALVFANLLYKAMLQGYDDWLVATN